MIMTVFTIILIIFSVFKCVPISTLPVHSSLSGENVDPEMEGPTARKIVFYPLPVVVPASKVNDVLHKDPEELQHILADKDETPFMPSHLPQSAIQKMSDLLKHPVMMELDWAMDNDADFSEDQLNVEEDQPVTPEPEESLTYFTDELSAVRTSTISHELNEQTHPPKNESRRPPVKLLQRLLRDYLPVVNPEVKKMTPPEKNPVISSLAKKTLKRAPSMKYPVFGNGQFFSLLNTLNVILNRKSLPPSKTYEPFKVPQYNVSFPKFTVNVSETLLEPTVFVNYSKPPASPPKPDCADEPSISAPDASVVHKHDESSNIVYGESGTKLDESEASDPDTEQNANELGHLASTENHGTSPSYPSSLNFETSSAPLAHPSDPSFNQNHKIMFGNPVLPSWPHLSITNGNPATKATSSLPNEEDGHSTQSPLPIESSSSESVKEPPHESSVNEEENLVFDFSSTGSHLTQTAHTKMTTKILSVTSNHLISSHIFEDSTENQQRPENDPIFNPAANTPAQPEFLNIESANEPLKLDSSTSHDESSHASMGHTNSHQSSGMHPSNVHTTFDEETQFGSTDPLDKISDFQMAVTSAVSKLATVVPEGLSETQTTPTTTSTKTIAIDVHSTFITDSTEMNPTKNQSSTENSLYESTFETNNSGYEATTPESISDSTNAHIELTSATAATKDEVSIIFPTKFTEIEKTWSEAQATPEEHKSSTQIFDAAMATTAEITESDEDTSNDKLDEHTILHSGVTDVVTSIDSIQHTTVHSQDTPEENFSNIDGTWIDTTTMEAQSPLQKTKNPNSENTSHYPHQSIVHENSQFSGPSSHNDDGAPEEGTTSIQMNHESSPTEQFSPEIDLTSEDGTEPPILMTLDAAPTTLLYEIIFNGAPNSEPSLVQEGTAETMLSTEYPEVHTSIDDTAFPSEAGNSIVGSTFLTTQKGAVGTTQLKTSSLPFELMTEILKESTIFDDSVFPISKTNEPSSETVTINPSVEVHPETEKDQATNEISEDVASDKNAVTDSVTYAEKGSSASENDSSIKEVITEAIQFETEKDEVSNEISDVVSSNQNGVTDSVTYAEYDTEGSSASENDSNNEVSMEAAQFETTAVPHETTSESFLNTDDLIIATTDLVTGAAPIETTNLVTMDEGETSSLFLGSDQVTERESTILSSVVTETPVGDETTVQTAVDFTDLEEEEIEDPFECETQCPTQKATTKSLEIVRTTSELPTTTENQTTSTEDERIVFQEIDYPTISAKSDGSPDISTTLRAPSNYLVHELDIEEFPIKPQVIPNLRSLPAASKKKAEKLLNLLSGELFIDGADWEENNDGTEENYEVDGSGMKIVTSGQRKGKWIENLSNDQLMALIESVRSKRIKS